MLGSTRWLAVAVALIGALFAGTQSAVAAPPSVSTGGAARVTSTTATVTGAVNSNGLATRYYFQYGTTRAYGARTGSTSAGAGRAAVAAVADLSALSPATRYHYRIVAHNRGGTRVGLDRSFRTARQPLGLAVAAASNPVRFGRGTVLSGTLSGTGNAGRQVVLQQNAFPFTVGFQPAGNPQVTNAAGGFAFPVLLVPITTQYRVSTLTTPPVVSPVVTVDVAARTTTGVSRHHVRRGRTVRFFGHVFPPRNGAPVGIQRQTRRGRWITIAGSHLRNSSAASSRYSRRVHVRHSGRYRVYVLITDGAYKPSTGPTVHLHVRR